MSDPHLSKYKMTTCERRFLWRTSFIIHRLDIIFFLQLFFLYLMSQFFFQPLGYFFLLGLPLLFLFCPPPLLFFFLLLLQQLIMLPLLLLFCFSPLMFFLTNSYVQRINFLFPVALIYRIILDCIISYFPCSRGYLFFLLHLDILS